MRRPQLPVYFIENQGQDDQRIVYSVQGRDAAAYFTRTSVFYLLRDPKPVHQAGANPSRQAWVTLEFSGANPQPVLEPLQPTSAIVSYFRGPRDQWKTGLPTYSGIIYRDLWPGIDLEFAGPQGLLKYTFHVRPGADPRQIRFAYRGASSVSLTPSGSLQINTPVGGFTDDKPIAWQDSPEARQTVSAAFRLDGDQVYFQLGAYDPTLPLTLDPVVLIYAGFLGGTAADEGRAIAVDAAGNAFVAGMTVSLQATPPGQVGFPVIAGPDLTRNGSNDAFVAKIDPTGASLIYAGFLGGSGADTAEGIAVDAAGNAYVTGFTASSADTFPVLNGPDLIHNGGLDAFVAKVNPAGTALVYCGYIGGSGEDDGHAVAVDAEGNLFVTGHTLSNDGTFPAANGPDLSHNGLHDAFVAKVNASGTALLYSGFLGGSNTDAGFGIAVDAAGNAYVVGSTTSNEATFPTAVGPDLTYNGGGDAFVTKVGPDGTAIVYSGFLGGSNSESGNAIAVDAAGQAYLTGYTNSPNFPATNGPDLTHNGGQDAFVAKVNSTGTALVYGGFVGGSGDDAGHSIALDAAGNAYVTGITSSEDGTFPVVIGPGLSYNGNSDAFVVKVDGSATALVYAGFLGGLQFDSGYGIAVDSAGSAYVTGGVWSTEATFPVTVGPDLTHNGGATDAFVVKLGAFPGTAGPVLALRNAFNAIETTTFPARSLRNSGGNFRLNPALALSASGRAFFIGRDSAVGVWINILNPDETYNGWLFAGGNSPGQPALAVAGEVAWIAVRDPWNAYSVRPYNPTTGFGPWTWLQGVFATDPQIAACPNGDLYITGRDNWNGIWTRRYSSALAAWQSWHFAGGIITGVPAITCGSDNAAYVAARDSSNNMWLARIFQESPAMWSYGEGIFQSDLQVAVNGSLIHVAGLASGTPWYRTWQVGAGWLGWTSAGGVLTHFAPATYGGQVFLAGQDSSGNLWWWTSLGNSWTSFGSKNVAPGSHFAAGAR